MTVNELMDELKKYDGSHTVLMTVGDSITKAAFTTKVLHITSHNRYIELGGISGIDDMVHLLDELLRGKL